MEPVRIGAWSGPRNISTAMMRAWDARDDTIVCDEPLYARYLLRTGADHPGRDEIIARCPTDMDAIVRTLLGPLPEGKSIFYQKHMAHHLLDADDLEWILRLRNFLLIRNPREMIVSYIKVVERPTPEALGLPQQEHLFHLISERTASPPPVVDARDVLENPRAMLGALCEALGVPFDESMLCWEPGPRPTDGPWAPYWYANVERSTTFAPWRPRNEQVPDDLTDVLDACNAIYERLHAMRLRA